MAPSKQCADCKKSEKNAKFINCGQCENDYHVNCAAPKNSSITESMIDMLNKSKGVIIFKCRFCQSNESSNKSENAITSKLSELEASIKELSKIISKDIICQLNEIKTEVAGSVEKSNATEQFVSTKFQQLQIENNSLRKQINRNDILVYGLSENLTVDEMYESVFSIGKLLGVEIGHNDLNLCTYIHRKKSILIKFNSVYKRDQLMKQYFAYGVIKRSQLVETDIHSRIYLNDNLTPQAAKLNYFCRKLLKEGRITKFRFFNRDLPEAKIFLPGGDFKMLSLEKIKMMFTSNTDTSNKSTQLLSVAHEKIIPLPVVEKDTGHASVSAEKDSISLSFVAE